MILNYTYRIYPDAQQQESLITASGGCHLVSWIVGALLFSLTIEHW